MIIISTFRVLNQHDIKSVLEMKSVMNLVEDAYVFKAKKSASLFPMVFHEFHPGVADMDIKSGKITEADIFGLKLVSWFGENPSKGIPAVIGTILVLDITTGTPLGILSGEYITLMRTGAAAGIGAKYLAREESEELLIVGSGHVAPYAILSTLLAMDNIKRVTIYNDNSFDRAQTFSDSIKNKLFELISPYQESDASYYYELLKKIEISFVATDDIKLATQQADIIITATPSRKPLIQDIWVQPGTHISCLGSDMKGKQEIDEELFTHARIFVDDIDQSFDVGESEIPYLKGKFTKQDVIAEIGEVILGNGKGRLSDSDITIYDSTGISLQDLITANHILKIAKEKNVGQLADL
ncbi:ornithine cyclodeaminase family protein [Lysinibacillus composti]|uniref:ornithine cyclodeaminase family protein n=1 Tax=Lysinibacillus composti TaxID=720633 RepID=UPI001F02DA35|nr:ornithine cyclodeaminase family protein [Lysinibacillus composti]